MEPRLQALYKIKQKEQKLLKDIKEHISKIKVDDYFLSKTQFRKGIEREFLTSIVSLYEKNNKKFDLAADAQKVDASLENCWTKILDIFETAKQKSPKRQPSQSLEDKGLHGTPEYSIYDMPNQSQISFLEDSISSTNTQEKPIKGEETTYQILAAGKKFRMFEQRVFHDIHKEEKPKKSLFGHNR